jgi:predicted RNA-binding Zn-ribbon protein involved in translation (DUF1610 family)
MNTIIAKCPSTDTTLKAVPETFACPDCGRDLEIWTDENKGKCSACSKAFPKELLQKIT